MELQIDTRENLVVVSLKGKFDIRHAKEFEEQVDKALETNPKVLGINLSKVDYMDSSGIGAIIRTNANIKKYDGKLVLFGVNQPLLKIFKIARLDSYFRILSADEFEEEFEEI